MNKSNLYFTMAFDSLHKYLIDYVVFFKDVFNCLKLLWFDEIHQIYDLVWYMMAGIMKLLFKTKLFLCWLSSFLLQTWKYGWDMECHIYLCRTREREILRSLWLLFI